MFSNYLKIAWRNLWRHKTYAGINIISIAIGLAAFWMIALYVGDELSYDRNLPGADRIYRVAQHARWEGGQMDLPLTSPPFAPVMQKHFPEVAATTRVDMEGGGAITYANKRIKVGDMIFSDENFFNVFQHEFIKGNPASALVKPQSIVITEELAKKLFGDVATALNQTIYFGNNYGNVITGIIKDIPANSHLRFSGVRSAGESFNNTEWQNFYLYTYIKLADNASIGSLQKKLPAFSAATIQAEMKVKDYLMELQPLPSIHLYSNLDYEISANGSIGKVYLFAGIGIIILLIAFINYMNLTTARSSTRVKEVGIRKVIGSGRRHLVGMFITESVLINCIAAIIAFFLVNSLLPLFNDIAGKTLTITRFGLPQTIITLTVFVLVTAIVSGMYPAVFLSRFKTMAALKGQLGNMQANIFFRKSLVVFQFMITVFMITGSLVIYYQMQYAFNKDLGFNKEQTLSFHIDDMNVRSQVAAVKAELLKSPLIESVSAVGNPIGNNDLGGHSYAFEKDGAFSDNMQMAQELMVDEDFLKTMDIQLAHGRNFSLEMVTDKSKSILINQTLMNTLGWKEALGKKMQFRRNVNSPLETRTVIGVIKDFHVYSLQHKIEPLVMMMAQSTGAQDNLYVKLAKGQTHNGLAYLKNTFAAFDKNSNPEFRFLDDNFAKQYAAEQKQQTLCIIFTILAVIIACLGLFGLATFTALQRVKEIGIRKVLGAGIASVLFLLSKDFLKLVCIATVIAIPIAWFAMNRWLQDFAYRIDISPWVFLVAAVFSLFIALFTISFQAIKAAVANPVNSLRTE